MKQRVFITGIGIISPAGIGRQAFEEHVWMEKSGISEYEPLLQEQLPVKKAGYVHDFDPRELMPEINFRRLSRYSRFTYSAVKMALDDAGLLETDIPPERRGLIFNTIRGSYETTVDYLEKLLTKGPAMVSPLKFSQTVMNAAATQPSLKFQLKGVSTVLSGMSPFPPAVRFLAENKADFIIVGGVDTISSTDPFVTFSQVGLLSRETTDKEENSCPADVDRNGFIYSEGAAFVVLETEESLQRRSGHAYAEIMGFAATRDNNALYNFTNISEEPVEMAMLGALQNAGINPEDVVYVNSLANGSLQADAAEAGALEKVFGSKKPAVSTFKGVTGEMFAASETAGIIQSALSFQNGTAAPVAHLKKAVVDKDGSYVKNKPRPLNGNFAVNNALEVGGNIHTTVLKRV